MPDYLSEISEIDKSALSLRDKYIRLKQILERNCKDITSEESLQFPSLFSRIVYISQKYTLPKSFERQLQNVRIKANFLLKSEQNTISTNQYEQAKETVERFLLAIDNKTVFCEREASPVTVQEGVFEKIRVQITSIDQSSGILECESDSFIGQTIKIELSLSSLKEDFKETIDNLWVGAQLNLIDTKIDKSGYCVPNIIVVEPDYLIDASAIAECFQSYGSSHLHYFRRKFEPSVNTHYILLGNLANFFLDELIYAEDIDQLSFDEVFLKSFKTMPFEYAACKDIASNADFKEFMIKAQTQFANIKRVVQEDMPANGFNREECMLEPSFFCEKYGFQGRLDLLQLSSDDNRVSRIVELKSGKPPYPREDVTRIAPNHETQTIVYRLMIQSVFGKSSRQIYPTILYSSAENRGENLRFAATYHKLEKEIINIRNMIIATEHKLYTGDSDSVADVFSSLFDLDSYGRVPQFFCDKLEEVQEVLDNASTVERAYFNRYVNFISRELYLLKVGDEGSTSSMSVASLWNTTFYERQDALELISDLEIERIDSSGRDMVISFQRTFPDECVNFREGEICILYPKQNEDETVLTNQILKGTVVEISPAQVVLRFRYKQRNLSFFSRYKYWTIEHDKLDHGYNNMFKSLFSFLSSTPDKKALLLGYQKPNSSYKESRSTVITKESKEQEVIDKAIAAQDYFLIVGPPGTGKTSIFARKLIEQLYISPDTNILVMAYTNRAVDELCAAICEAFSEREEDCTRYIRIGSELSCGEAYCHRLLQNVSHKARSRKELLDKIRHARIFVGTLASVIGKPELMAIKYFDVAIIDEASQILEPQIVGLLPLFDKFIMIGDHKQLSTITLQSENKSQVADGLLNSIELYDCRESLFERLFRICLKKEWTQAYDTLTYHGRMHEKIAELVNASFYDSQLRIATERQTEPLLYRIYDENDFFETLVATRRVSFCPVREVDNTNLTDKTNRAEADMVVSIAKAVVSLYRKNDLTFNSNRTLGIVAPYRNQIALIKHKLVKTGIPELADIMVDTVERYQGSQRDIILVSFCFNHPYQLDNFSNMNREGTVDRKLNVALTRAREQLFLIGNDYILRQNPIYKNILPDDFN